MRFLILFLVPFGALFSDCKCSEKSHCGCMNGACSCSEQSHCGCLGQTVVLEEETSKEALKGKNPQ